MRQKLYESPEQFDAIVDDYVEKMRTLQRPLTWTGLAIHLGFSSRFAVDRYAKYEGFAESVERAKLMIENGYEERLHTKVCVGAIFALKNMGWTDRQELVGKDGSDLFGAFARALKKVDQEMESEADDCED